MNSDTRIILKSLFAAYPNASVTTETVAVYVEDLSDIPTDELRAIIKQARSEFKFLPTIAELKQIHRTLTRDLSIPTAEAAWEEVRRSFGRMNRKPWSHPFVEEAVNVIGYRELCLSENQGNDMARFLRIYGNIVERDGQIKRLTPQARQLAERSSGLQPIAAVIAANARTSMIGLSARPSGIKALPRPAQADGGDTANGN